VAVLALLVRCEIGFEDVFNEFWVVYENDGVSEGEADVDGFAFIDFMSDYNIIG
jgi:hypothetical protein